MFKFNELQNIHLEITNRCQASCPMCSRNYHGGLENPLIKNQDWTIDDFKHIITSEVLHQINSFYFCGNFGDPIINNDLAEMCSYATDVKPTIEIRIHTNGGARSTDWWKKLAKALPSKHCVIFAIDGLADTHSLYRIGTDFDNVLKNAKAFINAGGIAEWAFIKFKHNEHQQFACEALATEHGFARFTCKDSARFVATNKFEVLDKKGQLEYYLEPPTGSNITLITQDVIDNYKDVVDASEIDCFVLKQKEIYITAQRDIMPCCFLASTPYNYIHPNDLAKDIREKMKSQHSSLIADLGNTNGLDRSIKDVIDSNAWQTVWHKYWNSEKLITCARTCGVNKLSKPKDQFIEYTEL
ncbi:radical SAM protein [bacterium]|nr:radical SAM protein [bacterium]